MKRVVKASDTGRYIDTDVYHKEGGGNGHTRSTQYAKAAILDYLSDVELFKIDGEVFPEQFVERLQAMGPYFDIDDVTYVAQTYNKSLVRALEQLESEYNEL